MLLILMATAALAAGDWRFDAGAEVSAEPHGVVDVGWRRGPWSVQWMTDTLDVRWDQGRDHSHSWAALRAEAWMAGLMMWPWAGGAPAPERALTASYLGVEGGHQWRKEQGWYLGVSGWARQVSYGALPTTTIPVPRAGPIGQLETSLGQWTEEARAELTLGASVQPRDPSPVAPHARLVLEVHPTGTLRPVVAVHIGWAHGQTDINKTRLGGLNPYVVPLAGAVWGEWWVTRYATLRAGLRLHTGPVSLSLVTDVADFDDAAADGGDRLAMGFAALGEVSGDHWFIETSAGVAPWIPRAKGLGRTALWLRSGRRW